MQCPAAAVPAASFAVLDRRARAGEALSVVFFGASLTWGANATDPQQTSYRALMMQYLRQAYPKCPFAFHDAAIGGPGSLLGMFRTRRDVLDRGPDLVFLDFTANDDPAGADVPTLAAYETILRELIEAGVAVVQVLLPFRLHAEGTAALPRVADHLKLAAAYGTGSADAVSLIRRRIASGGTMAADLWPTDPSHPDNAGYRLFFEAARGALDAAIADGLVCRVPPQPVFGLYNTRQRLILSEHPRPAGWTLAQPSRIAAFFDQQPSRWLDALLVADAPRLPVEPIRLSFTGTFVGLLGEGMLDSLDLRVSVDGRPVPAPYGSPNWSTHTRRFGGTLLIWRPIAHLSPGPHTIEIRPVLPPGAATGQLRIESLCVAG